MSAVKKEAKQSSISALFAKAAAAPAKEEVATAKKAPAIQTASKVISGSPTAYAPPKSSDPLVQEFYDQLSPMEVIAHSIAVEGLGTSYDITRTHGFLKWSRAKGK